MHTSLKASAAKRPGLSLLETTFVLLIMIGMLTAGIISAGYVMREGNARTEIARIEEMMSAARLLKTQTGYPANDQMGPELYRLGLIPDNHSHDNGQNIKNSFGGEVNFMRLGSGGILGIEYTNIPLAECRQIAHQIGSSYIRAVGSQSSNLKAITELDSEDIADFCDDNMNTLVFATDKP